MSSPSLLGDLGYPITAVIPLSTSTAPYYAKTSGTSTGTAVTTSRAIDLSRALHLGTTGGKPLNATVHPRAAGPPRWKSLMIAGGMEVTFVTSGVQLFVTVAHKTRAATSGAGSTWRTLKTDSPRRWKMGTDTAAVFHIGFQSSVNLQAVDRYYKANITFATRKASSTAAKDTTTSIKFFVQPPLVVLNGGDMPQVTVPAVGS